MNVEEVMEKVHQKVTISPVEEVIATPAEIPVEIDVADINLPLSNVTAVEVTISKDNDGIISRAVRPFEEQFGCSVVPLSVMHINADCKELHDYDIVLYNGSQLAMNKTLCDERVQSFIADIKKSLHNGEHVRRKLDVDVDYNGTSYPTLSLSIREMQEVMRAFSAFNARVEKVDDTLILCIAD